MNAMDPVQIYKSLSDEVRLRSLMLLQHERELCVCELSTALGEPQPKVSKHLALLRQAGMIIDSKHGKWVFYRLSPVLPQWVKNVLEETTANNAAYLADSLSALSAMADRPGRAALHQQ